MIITSYKIEHSSQFTNGTNINTLISGFKTYLEKEMELTNVTMNGNRITCYIGTDQVIFIVTTSDIKYSIK